MSTRKAVESMPSLSIRSLALEKHLGASMSEPAKPRRVDDRSATASVTSAERVGDCVRDEDVAARKPNRKERRERYACGTPNSTLGRSPDAAIHARRSVDSNHAGGSCT